MSEILGADPDALDAYATDARGLASMLDGSKSAYQQAWSAFYVAPVVPPLGKPGPKGVVVQRAVDGVVEASSTTEGYADALRALDANADGELAASEVPSAEYLDLFLQIRGDHRPHDVIKWDWQDTRFVSETPEQRLAHLKRETNRIYELSQELVEVVDDGSSGGPRQIRLDLNDPGVLEGYSREDLQQVLELHGIDGADPLHFVVHGYTTDTGSLIKAGDSVADLYSERGESDTTVVTVDWDSADNSLNPFDWPEATGNADEAAPALRDIFDAINDANPDADVKVSAHSLGNKVALNALTDMTTEGGFDVDYLAIQPAVPGDGYRKNPQDFGALVSDRIHTLTVTINDGDNALNKYVDYDTANALGEAEPGDDSIVDLLALRDELGLSTTIRDHGSQVGGVGNEGHLGLDPDMEPESDEDTDGDPLLDSYLDQIER